MLAVVKVAKQVGQRSESRRNVMAPLQGLTHERLITFRLSLEPCLFRTRATVHPPARIVAAIVFVVLTVVIAVVVVVVVVLVAQVAVAVVKVAVVVVVVVVGSRS